MTTPLSNPIPGDPFPWEPDPRIERPAAPELPPPPPEETATDPEDPYPFDLGEGD